MRARVVIVVGAIGILVGVAMAAGPSDSETGLGVALGLLLLGLAVWHQRSWGLGKLAVIGLLALSAFMVHLADYGSGEWVWNQGRTGDDLAGNWVVIVSSAFVMVGSVWSLTELSTASGEQQDEVAASLAFWRRWWLLVAAVLVAVWAVGILTSDSDYTSLEGADDPAAFEDEWSIVEHVSDDGGTSFSVRMVTTFEPLDETTVDDVGGRLVWSDSELVLCGVEVLSSADGAIQVGNHFPAREECEPAMVAAFELHGLPETGCVHVVVAGLVDEFCAPLGVEEADEETGS